MNGVASLHSDKETKKITNSKASTRRLKGPMTSTVLSPRSTPGLELCRVNTVRPLFILFCREVVANYPLCLSKSIFRVRCQPRS